LFADYDDSERAWSSEGCASSTTIAFAPWMQVARWAVTMNRVKLGTGDGAAQRDEARLELRAGEDAEVLLLEGRLEMMLSR
jgi:hypothetical protein